MSVLWFVRSDGDDANNGRSVGQAFQTLAKARTVATDGDTVDIGEGTFAVPAPALLSATGVHWQGAGDDLTIMLGNGAGQPVMVMRDGRVSDLTMRDPSGGGGCLKTDAVGTRQGTLTIARCVLETEATAVIINALGAMSLIIHHTEIAALRGIDIGDGVTLARFDLRAVEITANDACVYVDAGASQSVRGAFEKCTMAGVGPGPSNALVHVPLNAGDVRILIVMCELSQNGQGYAIFNGYGSAAIVLGPNAINGDIFGAMDNDEPLRNAVLNAISARLESVAYIGAVRGWTDPRLMQVAKELSTGMCVVELQPIDDRPTRLEGRNIAHEDWRLDFILAIHTPPDEVLPLNGIDGAQVTRVEFGGWLYAAVYAALIPHQPTEDELSGLVSLIECDGGGGFAKMPQGTTAMLMAFHVQYRHSRGRLYLSEVM